MSSKTNLAQPLRFKELCKDDSARFGALDRVDAGMREEMLATYWHMRHAWAMESRRLGKATEVLPGDYPSHTLFATRETPERSALIAALGRRYIRPVRQSTWTPAEISLDPR